MSRTARQLTLGTLVGGLILYGVHAAAWALFPWVEQSVHDLREQEAIAALLAHAEALPGTYFLNASEHRDGVGPGLWGWMTIHPPEAFSFGRSLLGGLVLNFGMALFTACVLLVVTGGYIRRVLVAGAVGLVALLSGPLYFWAWAWFSTPHALALAGNYLLAHGLMALALGKLVSGVTEARAAPDLVEEVV